MSAPAPSMQDLVTLLDLRERVEQFFDAAAQEWLDRQIATNPEFAHVTNRTGYVVEFDRDALVYAYYPDAWSSRNYEATEVRIPLGEFVPGYDEMRAVMKGLGAA